MLNARKAEIPIQKAPQAERHGGRKKRKAVETLYSTIQKVPHTTRPVSSVTTLPQGPSSFTPSPNGHTFAPVTFGASVPVAVFLEPSPQTSFLSLKKPSVKNYEETKRPSCVPFDLTSLEEALPRFTTHCTDTTTKVIRAVAMHLNSNKP